MLKVQLATSVNSNPVTLLQRCCSLLNQGLRPQAKIGFLMFLYSIYSSNDDTDYSFKNNFTLGNFKLSKVKDSLSHLLPELQNSYIFYSSHSESSNTEIDIPLDEMMLNEEGNVKVGDILSKKWDEDLESFQNDSNKADSTEDSECSSMEHISSLLQDSSNLEKLQPPKPVISTNLLATRTEKTKAKIKLFSFDNFSSEIEETKNETKKILQSKFLLFQESAWHVFSRVDLLGIVELAPIQAIQII